MISDKQPSHILFSAYACKNTSTIITSYFLLKSLSNLGRFEITVYLPPNDNRYNCFSDLPIEVCFKAPSSLDTLSRFFSSLFRHQSLLLVSLHEIAPLCFHIPLFPLVTLYHSTLQDSASFRSNYPVKGLAIRWLRRITRLRSSAVVFPSETSRRELAFNEPSLFLKSFFIPHGTDHLLL